MDTKEAQAWDAEYAAGRYVGERPVDLVNDIVVCAWDAVFSGAVGLYIGCGNGRNYLPLVDAGLDLIGLDISAKAIEQLAMRAPSRRNRLVVGDLSALPASDTYRLVVGIQVFQHGNRTDAHAFVEDALERVAAGGLFAVRVNAVGTDVEHKHTVVERATDGSFSVQYQEGPKAGLAVHFWAARELQELVIAAGFAPVLGLRPSATWRKPNERGLWVQWEGIYVRVG